MEGSEVREGGVARGSGKYSSCVSSPLVSAAEGPSSALELRDGWHSGKNNSGGGCSEEIGLVLTPKQEATVIKTAEG